MSKLLKLTIVYCSTYYSVHFALLSTTFDLIADVLINVEYSSLFLNLWYKIIVPLPCLGPCPRTLSVPPLERSLSSWVLGKLLSSKLSS